VSGRGPSRLNVAVLELRRDQIAVATAGTKIGSARGDGLDMATGLGLRRMTTCRSNASRIKSSIGVAARLSALRPKFTRRR
jgi:hypothetical protein